jgi:hypothetical protein
MECLTLGSQQLCHLKSGHHPGNDNSYVREPLLDSKRLYASPEPSAIACCKLEHSTVIVEPLLAGRVPRRKLIRLQPMQQNQSRPAANHTKVRPTLPCDTPCHVIFHTISMSSLAPYI